MPALTIAQVVGIAVKHPAIRQLGYNQITSENKPIRIAYNPKEVSEYLTSTLPLVVDQLFAVTDWDFAYRRADHIGGTVAGTDEYELRGGDDDAQTIFSIVLGNDETYLTPRREQDLIVEMSGRSRTSMEPEYWCTVQRDTAFPRVRIVGTPQSSLRLRYRYLVSNVDIQSWPVNHSKVLVDHLVACLVPKHEEIAEESLRKMIKAYGRAKNMIAALPVAPWLQARRDARNALYGYNS